MWDRFAPLLGERDVVRHELWAGDPEAALGDGAVLIGASFGGYVCLDLAARRPELVEALVLMDAPLLDHEASPDLEAYELEEERLLEAGDVDAAARLNVEFWVGDAPAEVKALVLEMSRRALELEYAAELPEAIDLERIAAPALVITGERDHPDFQAIAERLAAGIPDARRQTVADARHLPALERPEETAAVVVEFLERVGR
jgi:3-oxoadipate enol-lactonase